MSRRVGRLNIPQILNQFRRSRIRKADAINKPTKMLGNSGANFFEGPNRGELMDKIVRDQLGHLIPTSSLGECVEFEAKVF